MHNQSGFTLIEVLVVMVMIGLLAVLAVPEFVDLGDSAEAAKCKYNQMVVESAATFTFGENAMAGNPMFPETLSAAMFRHGSIPTCPYDGKEINYIQNSGSASCPNIIPEHARW